jgi:hypothetical protein
MWPERQVGCSLPTTAKVKKSRDRHLLSLYVFVVMAPKKIPFFVGICVSLYRYTREQSTSHNCSYRLSECKIFRNHDLLITTTIWTNGARGSTVWLRQCAKNRKVAVLIPDGDIGIFHWHNPSVRTMTLGLTWPLTEMSTRNISCGVKAAGA